MIGVGAMNEQRMMEGSVSFFKFNRNGLESRALPGTQEFEQPFHVAGKSWFGEQAPAVTAGNILQATIGCIGIIEADPASQMRQRRRPRPVTVILMPGYYATVAGGLVKKLIMPETHRTAEQLAGRHREGRMPKDIVKTGSDTPVAKGVEQHLFRIRRFIGMKFIKQMVARMVRMAKLLQFSPQNINLGIIQDLYAGEIAIFLKKGELLIGKPKMAQLFLIVGLRKKVANRLVNGR